MLLAEILDLFVNIEGELAGIESAIESAGVVAVRV